MHGDHAPADAVEGDLADAWEYIQKVGLRHSRFFRRHDQRRLSGVAEHDFPAFGTLDFCIVA